MNFQRLRQHFRWLGRSDPARQRRKPVRCWFSGKKVRFGIKNGPVEGMVNKIKFIKRQMFGRASFELLRRRVLLVA